MTENLRPLTPEARAKAAARRQENTAVRKNLDLLGPESFARAPYWDDLARARGIERLPDWNEPITTTRVIQWLNRLGVSRRDCAVWLGDEDIRFPGAFAKNNPRWPLRALVCTIIENVESGDAKRYPKALTKDEQELTLAEWVDYASANGINTPGLGKW